MLISRLSASSHRTLSFILSWTVTRSEIGYPGVLSRHPQSPGMLPQPGCQHALQQTYVIIHQQNVTIVVREERSCNWKFKIRCAYADYYAEVRIQNLQVELPDPRPSS